MKQLVIVSFLFVAACGGKSSGTTSPTTGGSCDAAASNIATAIPDLDDAGMTEVANAIAGICASDAWSTEAIACFSAATNQDEMQPCSERLTDAQQESLGGQMTARTDEDEDPMADEPEEPPMDDSELED